MKYKGKSVQWQRVRAKKGPQIKEVSQTKLTPEEQRKQEEILQNKANQMIKQNANVKENLVTPQWTLLVYQIQLDSQNNNQVIDQWKKFKSNDNQDNQFKQFNGYNLNSQITKAIAIETKLPLLMRGSSICVRVSRLFLYVKVSPLYELKLCLPKLVEVQKKVSVNHLGFNCSSNSGCLIQLEFKAVFDCSDRKLLIFLPLEEKVQQHQKDEFSIKNNIPVVSGARQINLGQNNQQENNDDDQQLEEIDDLLIGAI